MMAFALLFQNLQKTTKEMRWRESLIKNFRAKVGKFLEKLKIKGAYIILTIDIEIKVAAIKVTLDKALLV